jgi:hypothetical protein
MKKCLQELELRHAPATVILSLEKIHTVASKEAHLLEKIVEKIVATLYALTSSRGSTLSDPKEGVQLIKHISSLGFIDELLHVVHALPTKINDKIKVVLFVFCPDILFFVFVRTFCLFFFLNN